VYRANKTICNQSRLEKIVRDKKCPNKGIAHRSFENNGIFLVVCAVLLYFQVEGTA